MKTNIVSLFSTVLLAALFWSCASTPPPPVKESKSEAYSALRGKRYVVFFADEEKMEHTKVAKAIESKIKSDLARKGLVLVDFDQTSLSNILRNGGKPSEEQAKRVASNADLILTGTYGEEHLVDAEINAKGTYRTRLRVTIAITEAVSAIEKGRFDFNIEKMASNFSSAAMHAADEAGKEGASKTIEQLLYIYKD